jgi:hypothetical protein
MREEVTDGSEGVADAVAWFRPGRGGIGAAAGGVDSAAEPGAVRSVPAAGGSGFDGTWAGPWLGNPPLTPGTPIPAVPGADDPPAVAEGDTLVWSGVPVLDGEDDAGAAPAGIGDDPPDLGNAVSPVPPRPPGGLVESCPAWAIAATAWCTGWLLPGTTAATTANEVKAMAVASPRAPPVLLTTAVTGCSRRANEPPARRRVPHRPRATPPITLFTLAMEAYSRLRAWRARQIRLSTVLISTPSWLAISW